MKIMKKSPVEEHMELTVFCFQFFIFLFLSYSMITYRLFELFFYYSKFDFPI